METAGVVTALKIIIFMNCFTYGLSHKKRGKNPSEDITRGVDLRRGGKDRGLERSAARSQEKKRITAKAL